MMYKILYQRVVVNAMKLIKTVNSWEKYCLMLSKAVEDEKETGFMAFINGVQYYS